MAGNITLTIRGRFLNSNSGELKFLVFEAYKEMSASLKEYVLNEFKSAAELETYVSTLPDPETLRTILRSVSVEATSGWPPDLNIKFKDSLSHWRGGDDFPPDLEKMIQSIFDKALSKWSIDRKMDEAFYNMLEK